MYNVYLGYVTEMRPQRSQGSWKEGKDKSVCGVNCELQLSFIIKAQIRRWRKWEEWKGGKRTLSEIIAGVTGCLAEPGWAAALSIWASGTPWVVLVVIVSTVSPDVLPVTGAKTQTTRPIP